MKKLFYFFALIFAFSFNGLFAAVEEGKAEPFKTGQEVKAPEDWKQAGEFEERYQETKKEIEDPDNYKEATATLKTEVKTATGQKKTNLEQQIQQRENQYSAYEKAKKIVEEPAVDQLIKKYKEELAAGYQPVEPEKPVTPEKPIKKEEVPFLKVLGSWIAEGRVRIYEFFGNKEAVKTISQDLDKVYGEFGEGGLLSKARNNVRLARALTDLKERLGKNRQALTEYKDALEKGTTDQKIKDEVQETVADLMQLKEALKERDFSAGEREQLNTEITETLKAFGISEEQQKKLEKEVLEAHRKKVKDLKKRLEDRKDKVARWAINDVVAYNNFRKELGELIRMNIDNLSAEEQGDINLFIRDSLRGPSDVLWNELMKGHFPKKQAIMLDRYLRVNADYLESEKRYGKWYDTFLKANGKEARGLKEKPLPENYPDLVKKSLSPMTDSVVKNLADPLEHYNRLVKQVENFENYMQEKAVTPAKLESEQIILTDVFGELINEIKKQSLLKDISTDELVKVLIDTVGRSEGVTVQIGFDRAATIDKTPQDTPILQNPAPPAPEAPPPPPAPPLPKEKAAAAKTFVNKKKSDTAAFEKNPAVKKDPRQNLLADIQKGTQLKPTRDLPKTPKEEKGLLGALSKAMNARRLGIEGEDTVEENEDDWED